MKTKKIMASAIFLATLMLVAISFATTVNSSTTTVENKESPLYKIRTRLAMGERLGDLSTRFVRNRMFFLPVSLEKSDSARSTMLFKTGFFTSCPTFNCICAAKDLGTQERLACKTGFFTSCPTFNCICLN